MLTRNSFIRYPHFEECSINVTLKYQFIFGPTFWGGRVNQQPPMPQLAVLSTGWVAFFHSVPDGVHHSRFLFAADHCTFFCLFFICSWPFFLDLTPTLVPYLLSPTNTATLITSYLTDLAIVLITYPTNLATLLIIYPNNLTIRFRVETHKLINKFFTNV
jgi:hypothetical protein